MDADFRDMFEGLKDTANGLVVVSEGLKQAADGMKRVADGALRARNEHEDLRETVRRLEVLVLELVERSKKD